MGGRGGTEIETDSLGSASSIMGEAFSFLATGCQGQKKLRVAL